MGGRGVPGTRLLSARSGSGLLGGGASGHHLHSPKQLQPYSLTGLAERGPLFPDGSSKCPGLSPIGSDLMQPYTKPHGNARGLCLSLNGKLTPVAGVGQ